MRYATWSRLVARDVFVKARRFQVSWQDCTQNAMIGLLEAVDRYRPEHGVNFETYARHRVRGAVFNGLRSVRDVLFDDHMAGQRTHDRFSSLQGGSDDDPVDAFVGLTVGLGLAFLLDRLPASTPRGRARACSMA
jgi:RNA polymerase sigma factor for flagellar operon FliA